LNKQSKTLKRTIVLPSPPLTKTKIDVLRYIYQVYGRILVEVLDYMWSNSIASWTKAKKLLYRRFREEYPDVPSHYIHEAIRDAYQRMKSFKKLRKKDLAYADKPIVKKWSVGCDNQLWKLTLSGARIATYKGWICIPLQFHKQFWRYYNGNWVLRSSARWKIAGNRLYLYVVFVKDVEVKRENTTKIYGVDINENNITIYEYPANRAVTIITNFSKIVLGYAYRRAKIQQKWSKAYGVKGNKRLNIALKKLREKNVKKDVKLKLAKKVLDLVKDGLVVLEKLPKRFQDRVIGKDKRLKGVDVHRLKQSSIRGIHNMIIEKIAEYSIPYALVNPSYTSSTCPICGSKLTPMTGSAQRNGWKPRVIKCPRCGFTHDRDVIGAMNLVKRYLLDVGGRAVGLPNGVHDPYVEWLVAMVKRRAEAQPILARSTMT